MLSARSLPGLSSFPVNRFRSTLVLAAVLALSAAMLAVPTTASAAGALRVGGLTTNGRVDPLGTGGGPP